jgi:Ca-activated chloride channel family protein
MSFLNPQALYFLLPPLFIFFGFLLTQKEAQGSFFSDEVIDRLRVSSNSMTLKARNAIFLMIGFFLVIAMGSPVISDSVVKVKAKSADIMIALDISDSMLAEDVYPNRLRFAKQKAIDILKNASQERFGVVAFAKNSYLVSPLSFDHTAVSFLLRQLNTNSITEKGTNFLSLLNVVDQSIKKSEKKYLLILSDGGDKEDFSKEIALAKEKNIVVFILGIGTQKGAPIKKTDGEFLKYKGEILISRLNENISKLATSSGGVYIQGVNSDADIKAMLKEMSSIADKKELKSEEIHRYTPLFYYPLAIAIFLLLIATSSIYKKEKLNLVSLFIFMSVFFTTPHAEAGLLDFKDLLDAKKAYKNGEFEKSAKIYDGYAKDSNDPKAYYNEANALYKQGRYKDAIKNYKKAKFGDDISKANNLANIANAYVKQKTPKDLQKALKNYESSLKLHEDKDVRQNYELVKKALEKQKQQDKKQDKDNKNSKDKKNNQKDKKDSKDKNSSDKKKNSEDKKDSKEKQDSSKSEKSKDKKQNSSDDMKTKKDEKDEKKEDSKIDKKQDKKESLKQLKDKKDEDTKVSKNNKNPQKLNNSKMSDAEEKKYIDMLNREQNTYMYMLNKQQEEGEDEKPW